MSYLPAEIVKIVLAPAVQKKFLSKPKVPIQRYLGCYQMAFEFGAVLGHAFRSNFPWFIQFFSEPGRQYELAAAFNQLATEDLAAIGEPTNFLRLAMEQEESRVRKFWIDAGQTQEQIESLFQKWEMDPEEAFQALGKALNRGVAYGGTYPDLVEMLWKKAYETPPDPKIAEFLRGAGRNIPFEKWEALPLARQEEMLLPIVRAFLESTSPELAAQLDAQLA
jgi:hypothetical protein